MSIGERKGVTGGRKRKELAGRGLELSTPLREMPQTYFSLWCLGSWGFMGLPSPTMILVALNCVSTLIDAEAVLQPGGRLQPGPHLAPCPAQVPLSDPGLPQRLSREAVWGGSKDPGPEQEPGLELPHPQSLEAPKGKGTCLRSHKAGRGPRPGNKTVGDKRDFKDPSANVLILQVEKLRHSGRKGPAS